MTRPAALSLHPRADRPAPARLPDNIADLGVLLTPAEIAAQILQRPDRAKWVASAMPRDRVVWVGRERMMYELDARQWLASLRGARR